MSLKLQASPNNYNQHNPIYQEMLRMLFIGWSYSEIAEVLNEKGFTSPYGKSFTKENVKKAAEAMGLTSDYIKQRRAEAFLQLVSINL